MLVAKSSSLMHTACLTVVFERSHANDDGDDIALTVIIAIYFTSQRGHKKKSLFQTHSHTHPLLADITSRSACIPKYQNPKTL